MRLEKDGDPMEIAQEVKILPYEQMVYTQPRIHPGERDVPVLWDFEIQTRHLISANWPDIVIVTKKENLPWKLLTAQIRRISTTYW